MSVAEPRNKECFICRDETHSLLGTCPIICEHAAHDTYCHYNCIRTWIGEKRSPSCPLCRGAITMDDQITISDIEYTIYENYTAQLRLAFEKHRADSNSNNEHPTTIFIDLAPISEYYQNIIRAIRNDPTFTMGDLTRAYNARLDASLPKRQRKRRNRRGNRSVVVEEEAKPIQT